MPMNQTQYLTFQGIILENIETIKEGLSEEGFNNKRICSLLEATINEPNRLTEEAFKAKIDLVQNNDAKIALLKLREIYYEAEDLNLKNLGTPLEKGILKRETQKLIKKHIAQLEEQVEYSNELALKMQAVGQVIDKHLSKCHYQQEQEIKDRFEIQELWSDEVLYRRLKPINERLDKIDHTISQIVNKTKENIQSIAGLATQVSGLENRMERMESRMEHMEGRMGRMENTLEQILQLLQALKLGQGSVAEVKKDGKPPVFFKGPGSS